ncbi:antibiotic biosynthesis monooxygenase [Phenylobacterium sp. SCN 70-31]|uniref:antibiotic biosynthesis monooxygenase family protein n=1 Tax=Phenylobacterium sp. SCN 70-31 TaxID=1660129 RepID=UPI00086ACF94|nr:antibiotic biosynthesis monooxygenase [Phenylobacterium sp. SCN 70-31]ODT87301.1 MAG: antibiotic biosynthesis monooxygenase [Phenylobacterium sp. SCN 70-31]
MFLVLYEWRARPGKEAQFEDAWRRGTLAITRKYGSYGSRLGRTQDGRYVGAAEWPDEATWQAAMDDGMAYDDPEARADFEAATLDGGAPILGMTIVSDEIVR